VHVELVPHRREAVTPSGRRWCAGRCGGQVRPGHGVGVVDVQVVKSTCKAGCNLMDPTWMCGVDVRKGYQGMTRRASSDCGRCRQCNHLNILFLPSPSQRDGPDRLCPRKFKCVDDPRRPPPYPRWGGGGLIYDLDVVCKAAKERSWGWGWGSVCDSECTGRVCGVHIVVCGQGV
jgi:hypothetical protein